MKYNVLSYDPVAEDIFEFEWRFRARNVGASKALKTVNELLGMAYDRDISICVDQVQPYEPDIELPGEHQSTLF